MMKPWRLSSSVMILAPNAIVGHSPETSTSSIPDYSVCLVKRAGKSTFFPSSMVFPGGSVDQNDFLMAKSFFNKTDFPSVMKTCAAREVFEESGVMMLDESKNKAELTLEENLSWRELVHNDSIQFQSFCSQFGTCPDVQRLHNWCTYITPDLEHKRLRKGGFYTTFYLYICTGDNATRFFSSDNKETVSLVWMSPGEAISSSIKGEIYLPPPQFNILSELSQYPILSDLEKYVYNGDRQLLLQYPIQPKMTKPDSNESSYPICLCYPGDEAHHIFPGPKSSRNRMYAKGKFGGKCRYQLVKTQKIPLPLIQKRALPKHNFQSKL